MLINNLTRMWHMMGYYGNYGYGYGGLGLLGGVLSFLIWILVIFLIVMLVRRFMWHDDMHHPRRSSALDILNERYARGEINKEEYEQKKKDILM